MRQGIKVFLTILGIGTFMAVGVLLSMQNVSGETRSILIRTALLLLFSSFGIMLVAFFYFYIDKRSRRIIENHANFITHLYNSIPEGICQLTVRRPFRVVRINPEGMRILGYEEEAFNSGRGLMLDDVICPKDWEETERIFREACGTGSRYTYTHRLRGNGGGSRWVSGVVEKALDEAGNKVLITTFHDITKEKMEEQKKERERSLERSLLIKAISNSYPLIANCSLDRNTYHVLYQAADSKLMEQDGDTYAEIMRRIGSTVHPDDKERFSSRFGWEAICRGASRDGAYMEGRFLLTDQEYHWVSLEMIPVQENAVKDRIYIILVRQIDEQKNEEQMRLNVLQSALDNANAASSAKSEFLSRMSHDIRTPMNAIVGMTEIAFSHIGDEERVKYCLSKISSSSAHLLSLINDVLDMSKIESGKMTLNNQPFNLKEEILNMNLMLQSQIESKNLRMKTKFFGFRHDTVVGDSLRFRQIYLNIVGNSIKFTPDGGQITIELTEVEDRRADYGRYQFIFTDTGTGMQPEFLDRLFEPFERAHEEGVENTEGTGLGMSITKSIVELMHGSIQVESEPGKGTVFTVQLPFQFKEEGEEDRPFFSETSPLAERHTAVRNFSGRRILLAEDNELNREIARELIKMTGALVDEACDGQEAVEKLKDSPEGYYNMIITDIRMPKMNGYEASRAVRSMERGDTRHIPIIAMTANAFSDDVKRAKDAGMSGYIVKPVDTRALYDMMGQWLGADTGN